MTTSVLQQRRARDDPPVHLYRILHSQAWSLCPPEHWGGRGERLALRPTVDVWICLSPLFSVLFILLALAPAALRSNREPHFIWFLLTPIQAPLSFCFLQLSEFQVSPLPWRHETTLFCLNSLTPPPTQTQTHTHSGQHPVTVHSTHSRRLG